MRRAEDVKSPIAVNIQAKRLMPIPPKFLFSVEIIVPTIATVAARGIKIILMKTMRCQDAGNDVSCYACILCCCFVYVTFCCWGK